MRSRNLVISLALMMIALIILRKLGFGLSSLLLNAVVMILAIILVLSKDIFRTFLARFVLAASLSGSLALLQYWLQSPYLIIPILCAFTVFMLLSFKYVIDKGASLTIFVPVFLIYFLSVVLNPRQFHNLFRHTTYEDYVLSKYRQEQGLLADFLIDSYKKVNLPKSREYFNLAVKEDSQKHAEEALNYYSLSIANNPDNPIPYNKRGYLKLTRLELNPVNVLSALKDFSRAIRLDTSFVEAYYQRSIAFTYLGYYNRAYLDQLRVLQIDSILPDEQFRNKYGRSKKSLAVPPDS